MSGKEVFSMNKKIMLSLLLCLALGASLFALPAFADSTVIVIGGTVQQGTLPTATYDAAGQSAVIVSGNDGRNVVISSSGNAAAATANTGMKSSVVVMPDGQVQQISAQPVQQAQTQTAAQQGIQTSSAQTAAATTPTVVTLSQNTVPTAAAAEPLNDLAKNILAELNATRTANGLGAAGSGRHPRGGERTELLAHAPERDRVRDRGDGGLYGDG